MGDLMNVKLNFQNNTTFLFICLIIISLFSAYPQMMANWQGYNTHELDNFGLRYLREFVLILTVVYLFLWVKYLKINKPLLIMSIFLGVYIVLEFYLMLIKDYPPIVPISGLRIFQYIPFMIVGFVFGKNNIQSSMNKIGNFFKFFILIQLILGVSQIITAPPIFGSTLFGSRPFGTYTSPNLYGLTMVTVALFLLFTNVKNRGLWIFLSILGAAMSGSRSAFIVAAIIILYRVWIKIKKKERIFLYPLIPVIAYFLYQIVSSKAISGRNIAQEERLSVWNSILSNVNSTSDFLFGWGLGLGSNTITNLFGYGYFPGQFTSDSTLIFIFSSFGIVGLLFYLFSLIYTYIRFKNKFTLLFILFVFFYSNVFIIWEVYPVNVIFMLLWGWILGQGKFQSRVHYESIKKAA